MSVLSKNWLAVTASFPILNFNFHRFYDAIKSLPAEKNKDYVLKRYFKYITYTTSRFCEQQNVSAHTLNLVTSLYEPAEIEIVDRCLGLLLMKGVKVLVIDIQSFVYVQQSRKMYRVPNVLLSSSSLISLIICNCELPSSLMVDVVKFKSLKYLELVCVPINEDMIKRLTMSCPLLEKLMLKNCYGFTRFSVYGHQNLQKVWIYFNVELERIDIEAPNMCYLFLLDIRNRGAPSLNLASCKKLTTLAYFGYPYLTSNDLASFLTNFPIRETLVLDLPDKYNNKNLRLSSHSLKTFVLNSELELEEIDINTANLLLFYYQGRTPHNTLPSGRKLSLSGVRKECEPTGVVNALWFQSLRRFLEKKIQFKKLELRISALLDLINDVEELKVIQSVPYELKQVVLEPSIIEVPVYVAVVEAVLWCCCPQYLTLKSNFPCTNFKGWSHIVKFTYEKLLQQEDGGITNIQIVLCPTSSKEQKCFSDLNSFLTALPSDRQGKTITFIKEKILGWQNIRHEVGLQLSVAGFVLAALSSSHSATLPPPTR